MACGYSATRSKKPAGEAKTPEAKTSLAALSQHMVASKKAANPSPVTNAKTTTTNRSVATVTTTANPNAIVKPGAGPIHIEAVKHQPPVQSHLWNLQNVDILKVIAEVARETGKNFVIDPQVTGKVTLVSNKPLSSQEIYQVFLSTLQVLGYGAVPTGNVIKIVPLRDAGREANTLMRSGAPKGDAIVVEVIKLRYVPAVQLVPILNPLIPTWASVSAVTTSNNLIISGTSAIVNRIVQLVDRIDIPEANGVDVIQLQYATAADVATELNKLIQSARAYGDTVNAAVSADDRSNSIMLSGNQADRLRLKVLITQLDQGGGANGSGDTQVIHLHYIQVQDILPILRGIAHQNSSASGLMTASQPVNNSSSSMGSNGSSNGMETSSFTNQVQSITNAQLNSGAVTGDGSKQQIIITGDVTNNALIITAPAAMMHQLRSVISHLDMRPEQVLVQGIIAEVDASKANNLGIQWGTNALSSADATSGNSSLGPTSPFSATGGMGVGFIQNGSLRGLVQLLTSDSNSNILSTPSITVLNNGHADIEVGQTISETTGQYQPGSGTNTQPFVQYQDKNLGLTLQVTPQITGDDSIRLAIDQTNSSVVNNSTNSASPNPSTNQEKFQLVCWSTMVRSWCSVV